MLKTKSKTTVSAEKLSLQQIQSEFNKSNLAGKIQMFSRANHGRNYMSPVNQQFCQRNWHHLIYFISTPKNGKLIYKALYNENAVILPIWPTVAAIKTIRIWAKSKIISDIATGCSDLVIFFQASLEAWRVEIAKIILKKM